MDNNVLEKLLARLDSMEQRSEQRFGSIDKRLDSMEERFERRFSSIDQRFDSIDKDLKVIKDDIEKIAEWVSFRTPPLSASTNRNKKVST